MNRYLTAGLSVLAGAAILEAALIPGLMIGAAAVLAPKYLPRSGGRRRSRPSGPDARRGLSAPARIVGVSQIEAPTRRSDLKIGQAIAKTITFRLIVTTLDFSTNYIVIGDLATAAGLSAFGLVVGPLFYLAHETTWNYFGAGDEGRLEWRGLTVNRALAKTITFRTIATVLDFTANYVVVGELLTAAGLSAFAFVVGPFVYLGHEMAWDRLGRLALPGDKELRRPAVA